MPSRLNFTIKDAHGNVKASLVQEVSEFRPIAEIGDANGYVDQSRVQYKAVGACIYCGKSEELTREHIIPFGLNGTAVLPSASCKDCARATSITELHVLRGSMRPVRVFRRMRSRKGHDASFETQRLTLVKDGEEIEVDLPLKEYPILLTLPVFAVPAELSGKETTGIDVSGFVQILYGPSPEDVLKKLGGQSIRTTPPSDRPEAFAKVLAKIALTYAIANGHTDLVSGNSLVTSSILEGTPSIGRWVGTLEGPPVRYPGIEHRLVVHEDYDLGYLLVEVQLFADTGAPSYGVLVKRLHSRTVALSD